MSGKNRKLSRGTEHVLTVLCVPYVPAKNQTGPACLWSQNSPVWSAIGLWLFSNEPAHCHQARDQSSCDIPLIGSLGGIVDPSWAFACDPTIESTQRAREIVPGFMESRSSTSSTLVGGYRIRQAACDALIPRVLQRTILPPGLRHLNARRHEMTFETDRS